MATASSINPPLSLPPSPPLNWKQMRAAGDYGPSEGQFNYCDTDRQDSESEGEEE